MTKNNSLVGAFATFFVTCGSYLYYLIIVEKRSMKHSQSTPSETLCSSSPPIENNQHQKFLWEAEGNPSDTDQISTGQVFCVFIDPFHRDSNGPLQKDKPEYQEQLLVIEKLRHYGGKLQSCACCA
jgi:hypothetical protein